MNILRSALMVVLVFSFTVGQARAEIPPKARAFMMVSAYGAGGGALLGLASMAFGTSSRAIAQGASLGLYAGILFGTYVLVSHHNRRQGSYDDRSSPYKDDADGYEDYGDETKEEGGGGGFFDSSYGPVQNGALHASTQSYRAFETKKGGHLPPLRMNLLTIQF
jgi:hypothetical protein